MADTPAEVPKEKNSSKSSLVTGGVTLSAASLVPVIQWMMAGAPHPVPAAIPVFVAAVVFPIGHAAYNSLMNRLTKGAQ